MPEMTREDNTETRKESQEALVRLIKAAKRHGWQAVCDAFMAADLGIIQAVQTVREGGLALPMTYCLGMEEDGRLEALLVLLSAKIEKIAEVKGGKETRVVTVHVTPTINEERWLLAQTELFRELKLGPDERPTWAYRPARAALRRMQLETLDNIAGPVQKAVLAYGKGEEKAEDDPLLEDALSALKQSGQRRHYGRDAIRWALGEDPWAEPEQQDRRPTAAPQKPKDTLLGKEEPPPAPAPAAIVPKKPRSLMDDDEDFPPAPSPARAATKSLMDDEPATTATEGNGEDKKYPSPAEEPAVIGRLRASKHKAAKTLLAQFETKSITLSDLEKRAAVILS